MSKLFLAAGALYKQFADVITNKYTRGCNILSTVVKKGLQPLAEGRRAGVLTFSIASFILTAPRDYCRLSEQIFSCRSFLQAVLKGNLLACKNLSAIAKRMWSPVFKVGVVGLAL